MNGVRDSRYYFKWSIRREPPERLSLKIALYVCSVPDSRRGLLSQGPVRAMRKQETPDAVAPGQVEDFGLARRRGRGGRRRRHARDRRSLRRLQAGTLRVVRLPWHPASRKL